MIGQRKTLPRSGRLSKEVPVSVQHKTDTGRHYAGIPIHAADGVHEYVGYLTEAELTVDEPILELGAGSGALTKRLLDQGCVVAPVDIDGSTWACPGVELTILDLNDRDWPQQMLGQYRTVVAVELIEHLENPRQFMRNLARVTSPGGTCILTTPNVCCSESIQLLGRKGWLVGFDPEQYRSSGHISILPWWLLCLMAWDAGFDTVRVDFTGSFDMRGARLILSRVFARFARLFQQSVHRVIDDGVVVVMVLKRRDQ